MGTRVKVPWILAVIAAIVAIYLFIPTLVVVPLSFADRPSFQFLPEGWSLRYYEEFFTNRAWAGALANSFRIAIVVMLISAVLGTAAAFGLRKLAGLGRFIGLGQGAITGLLAAPLLVPGIITAIAIYAAFLQWHLVGSDIGFVLAHTALAIPFVLISVTSSLQGLDDRLVKAAAGLGASPVTVFRKITLPLILPGVLAGAVFAFVTSFDEVVIALFLQSPKLRTLPVQMFISVNSDIDPTMAAASTVVMVLTTALVLLPLIVRRKRPA